VIAKLTGVVDQVAAEGVVLDVGGVGYQLFCSARTQRLLPGAGEAARLLVETHVREDHIHLYGFIDEAEKSWFRLLTTVQGVGAKVALAILSALVPERLHQAILQQDKAALAQAEGVGPKLAARVCNELRDKVGGLGAAPGAAAAASVAAPAGSGAEADALSALLNLGYKRAEAAAALGAVARRLGPDAKVDALIRAGLQELAR
jgi:Holliday junction DNA helicase RuvA